MSEIAELFKQSVPDADLRLHLLGDRYDLSRYRAEFANVNGVVLGHQMHFTAASSQYLRYPVADWRSADSLGTISAWIKLDSVGADQSIFGSSDEGGTSHFLYLTIVNTNKLRIYAREAGNDIVDGNTTLVAGQWYYVAVVSDGSQWALYLNGQPETLSVASGSNSGDWLADVVGRDSITVGALVRSDIVSYFDGNVRVLKYRSRVVPATELLMEYETLKKMF